MNNEISRQPGAIVLLCDDVRVKEEVQVSSSHVASLRVLSMLVVGGIFAVVVGLLGFWTLAPVVGWIAACLTFTVWVWIRVGRLDSASTKAHSTREDPSRGVADVLLVVASIASLVIVGFALVGASTHAGAERLVIAGLAIVSVALSWLLIHTLFMLRYASLYYAGEPAGGVDFNQDAKPDYGDFAYLSFTLGMTYQVSDTALQNRTIRMTVLRHTLLSYLFGAVILGTIVNLVAGLGS